MNGRRLVPIAVPVVLFVAAAVFVAALLGHGNGPLGTTLAVGTVSSLVATMIVNLARVVVAVRTPETPTPVDLGGLVSVKAKDALASSEWLHVLQSAKREFYIAGHSLGRWCSATNQEEFKEHLTRLLRKGGHVTLVMLDPHSPQIARLQKATSVDYRDRIQTSLAVLADLEASLNDDQRRQLAIAALPDELMLPYMVVGNEGRLLTSTYLGSSDSDKVVCIELERSSDAASAVYDDFRRLAEAGARPVLPEATTFGRPFRAALYDRLSHLARRWRA